MRNKNKKINLEDILFWVNKIIDLSIKRIKRKLKEVKLINSIYIIFIVFIKDSRYKTLLSYILYMRPI